MRWGWLVVACVASLSFGLRCSCKTVPPPQLPLRFATFNIEDFPKSRSQVHDAFTEIVKSEASVIAVQEIGDSALFEDSAQGRLGPSWRFVHIDTRPIGEVRGGHDIGVLFDGARWKADWWRAFDDTRLAAGRHKPVLAVHLRGGGIAFTVLVVHLKSGRDGREIRATQLYALANVIRRVAKGSERIVVLGDFNATSPEDRDDLAGLARESRLVWASEPLACTAFWDRTDGCPRSRLDHVLMWTRPVTIRAGGACATEGCDWEESCPLYAYRVSDHCPVIVTVE